MEPYAEAHEFERKSGLRHWKYRGISKEGYETDRKLIRVKSGQLTLNPPPFYAQTHDQPSDFRSDSSRFPANPPCQWWMPWASP